MGQKQVKPYNQYEKQYTIVSTNQNDELLVRHKINGKQFMLRKIIVKSEQQLEERLSLLNKRKKIKSQHLLNIVDFKPYVDDKICGNTKFISLLIQYPFQTLYYQTLHRVSHTQGSARVSSSRLSPLYFQEHELWSILYSCALGLQILYLSDLPHQSITKNVIFIDKQGVVKIGDPIILGGSRNYQKVIDLIDLQKVRRVSAQEGIKQSSNSNFYSNDKNQNYLKRLNHIKQSSSVSNAGHQAQSSEPSSQKIGTHNIKQLSEQGLSLIISPELISLCKDHQYYFFNKELSDVFVLGALMIELATLQNVASANVREPTLKKDFNQWVGQGGKLKEKYSQAFVSLLEQMTKIDPKQRPSLSTIVQKIQQFSIQQNSSDLNSLRHNSTELAVNLNKKFESINTTVPGSQFYSNDFNFKPGQSYQPIISNTNVTTSSYVPQYSLNTGSINLNSNSNTGLINQTSFGTFPSFSIQPNQQYQNYSSSTGGIQQSAVKSLFSKKLPIQIKYAESPLTIPVSNLKRNDKQKLFQNPNSYTPFNHLNLTQSNQKNRKKENQQESVVQNKFTLLSGNGQISRNYLFQPSNRVSFKKEDFESQRFSINKFGKIQIPNNSNNSIHTSMLPTPRFQNSSSSQIPQSKIQVQQLNKPLFPSNLYRPLDPIYSQNGYTFTGNFSNLSFPPAPAPIAINSLEKNTAFNRSNSVKKLQISNNLNQLKSYDQKPSSSASSYNPKKQGFSISDEYQDLIEKDKAIGPQPYFSNSSVGYTLPKYRPDSSSSEVIAQTFNKQEPITKNQIHEGGKLGQRSQRINQNYESFVQSVNISHLQQKQLQRNASNAGSMINAVSNLINDRNDTISNSSSQNTVKKENISIKKLSGQKKYNFYKKQLDQKLQKMQQPLQNNQSNQLQNVSMAEEASQLRFAYDQNMYSPIHKESFQSQQQISHSQNSITPITFQQQKHSVYVEEQEQNGSFYRGTKLNKQKHGSGILYFADSGFYEGQFNHGAMEGQGKLFYNQHDIAYQGQFSKDCFHGHGVLHNIHAQQLKEKLDFANLGNIENYWRVYDGYFREDQKSGKCHIYFTNGQQFQGYCQNNTFEGAGRFRNLDGEYIDGIWKNNVLVEIKNQGKVLDFQQYQ